MDPVLSMVEAPSNVMIDPAQAEYPPLYRNPEKFPECEVNKNTTRYQVIIHYKD